MSPCEGHRPVSGLYMLDTNLSSELDRNPQGSVAARIAEVGPDAICVSIITAAELRYGCARKGSARMLAQIEAILDSLQIPALDVTDDTAYGGIREELEAPGKPNGTNAQFMASHARVLDTVPVNRKE